MNSSQRGNIALIVIIIVAIFGFIFYRIFQSNQKIGQIPSTNLIAAAVPISSVTIYDASNNTAIKSNITSSTVNIDITKTPKIQIRAFPAGTPGSVCFKVGTLATSTENLGPYYYKGDPPNFFQPTAGTYLVKITSYGSANCTGTSGTPFSFTLIAGQAATSTTGTTTLTKSPYIIDQYIRALRLENKTPWCPVSKPGASPYAADGSWHVIGSGTAESCSNASAELNAALTGTKNKIKLSCGAAKITFTQQKVINKDVLIDGGGAILDGGGNSRLFYIDTYGKNVTFQNMTMQNAVPTSKNYFAFPSDPDMMYSGGAISYPRNWGTAGILKIINVKFYNNHAIQEDTDFGGGAIYKQGGELIISDSIFESNSGANGGAIASLGTRVSVLNSTFSKNAASGHDGTYAFGGQGGSIYVDGVSSQGKFIMCDSSVTNSVTGAKGFGGGVYLHFYQNQEAVIINGSITNSNKAAYAGTGPFAGKGPNAVQGGGLWHRGVPITIWGSTISNNYGTNGGGMYINLDNAVDHIKHRALIGNTTINTNVATAQGGAARIEYGQVTQVSNTKTNNDSLINIGDEFSFASGAIETTLDKLQR